MWKFAHSMLDRQSHLRGESAQLKLWKKQTDTQLILFNEHYQILMAPDGVHAANVFHNTNKPGQHHWIYLGHANNKAWFCAQTTRHDFELSFHQQWKDLRLVLPMLAEPYSSVIAYGKAMLHWHNGHKFCGRCGESTYFHMAGHERFCQSCEQSIYPRTDPAIIVSVTFGQELLLARQANWPEARYSVLAGFVEPGESFEQAVEREVREESQLDVKQIQYLGSQPWPFPCSIMIGFTAVAKSQDFKLFDQELEHALWVSPGSIVSQLESGSIKLPTGGSISGYLIEHWAQQHDINLAKYQM
ncbi:NAD(+) diphosphatase [Pleionea sediminis]|uniref:NAD(+) diphosphatase n=1 Tax=Pleionea sediminis TaxID=2569479 RepID=UPI0011862ED3|nr:NAD(+) diphosphatase [Pleionea sediminis]